MGRYVRRVFGFLSVVGLVITSLSLTSCGTKDDGSAASSKSDTIVIGTTNKVTALDPAASFDTGSKDLQDQVFGLLYSYKPGSTKLEPYLASEGKFNTAGDVFEVKLKPDLHFANGHDITSADVKTSFERVIKIADANGPESLLDGLSGVTTSDKLTAEFHLKQPFDQTIVSVLSSPAGFIVDHEVFHEDKAVSNEEIVKANAFSGPYTISQFKLNENVQFAINSSFKLDDFSAHVPNVILRYYTSSSNLTMDLKNSVVDVAYHTLLPSEIVDLKKNDQLDIAQTAGGQLRFMVFNLLTMPYGEKSANPDPEKAKAVRQAAASLIDRDYIAEQVYKGTYEPAYSLLPEGFPGHGEPFKEYTDNGKPNKAKAQEILKEAGVQTPVTLSLQYNTDHYGAASADEYNAVKTQLEASGLFKVNLAQTEWVQFNKKRTNTDTQVGEYPAYQQGWFPDFSDSDNYLKPLLSSTTGYLKNNYKNEKVDELIAQELGERDDAKRGEIFAEISKLAAEDASVIPLLFGAESIATRKNIHDVAKSFTLEFTLQFAGLSKG
jgi:peptide/nickel transport system substrate-binding protein